MFSRDAPARPLRQFRPHAAGDGPDARRRLEPHPPTSAAAPAASRPTSTSTTAATRSGRSSRSTSPGSSSTRSGSRSAAATLAIVGERPVQETEGRVYQQVEIPSGPFRRVVELQVEVDAERAKATYEDGVLRIELPLRDPAETTRRVPIGRETDWMEGAPGPRSRRVAARRRGRDPRQPAAARGAAGPAAARHRHLPGDADPAGGRPGALDQARRRRPRRQPDAGRWSPPATPRTRSPGPSDLYDVGVVGVVARMVKVPDGTLRILVQGTQRVRLGPYVAEQPYLVARIAELPDVIEPTARARGADPQRPAHLLGDRRADPLPARGAADGGRQHRRPRGARPPDRRRAADLAPRRSRSCSRRSTSPTGCATSRRSSPASSRWSSSAPRSSPRSQSEIDKGQREFFLRQQLKAIQDELGEGDEQQAEVNELREQIEAAELPEHARKAAERELSRLEKLPPAAAEHGVIRTYLEWLVELPWSKRDRGQPRHRPRPRGPRRRPLRPREGQGPDPRVPGGAQAEPRLARARSSASSARPASARPASAARSPGRWGASSSGSRSAASATRPRSAATAAPTSAPCRGRSSAPCATPAPATPSS